MYGVLHPAALQFDSEAHTFEQDETLGDQIAFSIRRGLINHFKFEDGEAASKIRVIFPQLVPWSNARFANILITCGYDFNSTPSRLEGKLAPEGLMKRCKIPKSFFVSHFASVYGKLEKVKLEYAEVALSTVEEQEIFLPYKKPPRWDKLANV
eukprot:g19214.t1